MHWDHFLIAFSLPYLVVSDIVPYPYFIGANGFGTSSVISADCAAALNKTISSCEPLLQGLALSSEYISPNDTGIATSLCASTCRNSISSYQNNVVNACGSSPVVDPGLANTAMGDLLHDYFDLICAKDPDTGLFCADFLTNAYMNTPIVSSWSQLPHDILCSSCQVSYFQTLQKSPFLGYSANIALDWQQTQKACGINSNLAVLTNSISFSAAVSTSHGNTTCKSKNMYTTKNGDTCESISLAESVAQGSIWAINNLFSDCSITVGQSLCLPGSCKTYTITSDDTCFTIATNNNITYSTFLNYNPTISADCSNLHNTSIVCISNPDGDFIPLTNLPANDTVASTGKTKSQYARSVVDPPGSTPFGTTKNCGGYYQVQVADTCQRISLAAGVSVELFTLINPSIDKDCFNLIADLWYCVHPTIDWNTTSTTPTGPSSTVDPPAATPPGTTNICFKWHVIVSGDTCFNLQNTLGVSMANLILWNPNLAADCTNLLLGKAYCVDGSATSTVTATATATATASGTAATNPPASTPTGVCVAGIGADNFAGLCSFSCNFGFCPDPCTCTVFGAQVPPPPANNTMGFPAAGLTPDYIELCSFTCSHGYCPEAACTTDQASSSVPGAVCNAGLGLNPNQVGLCSFACNYGFCPAPVCICTGYGDQVPPPPITGDSGVPLPGEDGSYLGLCSYACNHGYCPEGACMIA
ncbi:hypothetical protein F5884DRAFT_901622 [Xylogone sp. PMI_703]|nr:hypothetical protein F5884DRAFT_901622 [Xylogone sp. PMI_703]